MVLYINPVFPSVECSTLRITSSLKVCIFQLETLNLNLLDARHRAEHLRSFQALLRGYRHCSVFTEEEEAKDPVQAV